MAFVSRAQKAAEEFFVANIKEELNPVANNEDNVYAPDIMTTEGSFDAQLTGMIDCPPIDFVSTLFPTKNVIKEDGSRDNELFGHQVNYLNKKCREMLAEGKTLRQVIDKLNEVASRDIKAGKVINDEYRFVGYLSKDHRRYVVIDLDIVREMNDVTILFNKKAHAGFEKDGRHSAYIKLTPFQIRKATVTDRFM